MPDYGRRMADKALRTVDRKLRSTYRQAEKEIKEKLASFTARFEKKSAEMQKKLADGLITQSDYDSWLIGQVFQHDQWNDKLRQIQAILLHHDEEAQKIVREKQMDVFAQGYNLMARGTQEITGKSFGMYDAKTVARLVSKKPQILPKWKIDEPKQYKWSAKKAQAAIKQGIIQGEGIDKITKRMAEALCTQADRRMELFARTATTEAENAGRLEMLVQAEEMGIKVRKKWLATLDNRTRDSHIDMDGEEAEVEQPFSNGLMYPGDPGGEPSEVYNCRCTMVYVYPDYK